jgi:hypothetical protein
MSQVPVIVLMLSAATASSQVVVPNSLTEVEGNLDNNIPWNDEAPVRYQQVFLGTEVGPIVELQQIRFRQDDLYGEPFSNTIPDVTIILTSIPAGPDGLSMVFSENLGADAMVVYSGPLHLRSRSLSGSPHPFDIAFNIQQTFDFDPSSGLNLLMDVTIPEGPVLTAFDAENSDFDSVSRVFCWVEEECLTTDDAMIADTVGLVTMLLPKLIFEDGFESGDTSVWSETVP